jgi:hypothetical protein
MIGWLCGSTAKRTRLAGSLSASIALVVAALAVVVSFEADAQAADSFRIPIFGCSQNGGTTTVPAGTPLWVPGGSVINGTRGLLVSDLQALEVTLLLEQPVGSQVVSVPLSASQVEELAPGVWLGTTRRADLAPLTAGDSIRLTLTRAWSRPEVDVFLPWADTDQLTLPPYDGTGLLAQDHYNQGVIDVSTCTVTAV